MIRTFLLSINYICVYTCTYTVEPFIQDKNTSINRTHFAVPNNLFVYITRNQDTSLIRTLSSVPRVSGLERFHCIGDPQHTVHVCICVFSMFCLQCKWESCNCTKHACKRVCYI